MTTKTIEKTIIEKTTIYVSSDGKEWESKEDCQEWERGVQCVAKTSWDAIPKTEVSTTSCGLPWSNDDEEAYIVIPRNHEDIIALENYCRVYSGVTVGFSDNDIGKAMIVNFGYDHDWCGVTDIEAHLKEMRDYFDTQIAKINK